MALSQVELTGFEAETGADPAGPAGSTGRRVRASLWIPALVLVVVLGSCLLLPPTGVLVDPNTNNLAASRLPIGSPGHLLGTDQLGRDLLSRALHGGGLSFLIGVASVAIGLFVGSVLGIAAGFRGGWLDALIMRVLDVFLAFPSLVLALAVAAYLGPSTQNVIFAISFFSVPFYARVARAATLKLREREFVVASQLGGLGPGAVVRRHIVPNVAPDLISYGVLLVGVAMIVEASLSYLGLGVRPPQATWGTMIADAQNDLSDASYLTLIPGAFLFATVISFNLVGDALRSQRRNRA